MSEASELESVFHGKGGVKIHGQMVWRRMRPFRRTLAAIWRMRDAANERRNRHRLRAYLERRSAWERAQ